MPQKILLNKDLFRLKEIYTAVADYKGIASIRIEENDQYYICIFSNCIYGTERTIREFENYLIDLMNTRTHA